MSIENLEGKAKDGVGHAERAANAAIDDGASKAKGEVREFAGKAQQAVDTAGEVAGRVAAKVREGMSRATDQAADTYATLRGKAQDVAEKVDPFVKEKPYLTVGLAALAGVVAGVLMAGRGPKVIYIKPKT